MTETLVERLRKRAEIRRKIPRGEPDRIADLLEEAANKIDNLESVLDDYYHAEYYRDP
jgi:hypothetical protein